MNSFYFFFYFFYFFFFFFSPRIWFYSDINSTSHSGPESPHVLDRAALDSLPCKCATMAVC